jgi:putative transposase
MFSIERTKAIQLFKEFNFAENKDRCLDYDQNVRLTDAEANDFIKSISFVKSPTEVRYFDRKKRNEVIKACREKGMSLRQIERLTGVSFGIIRAI